MYLLGYLEREFLIIFYFTTRFKEFTSTRNCFEIHNLVGDLLKASYLGEMIFERIEFNFTPSVSHLVKKEKNAKIQFLPKSADLDLMKTDGILFTNTNTAIVPLSERNR